MTERNLKTSALAGSMPVGRWCNAAQPDAVLLAAVTLLVTASSVLAGSDYAHKTGDWPMWGGAPDRNMVSGEKGIPAKWNLKSGENILWTAKLGSQTYGNPVVVKGKVFVGTNNEGVLRPGIEGDKGLLVCFDEKTGKMLWQITHDKMPTGRVNDWPLQGICSAPWTDDGKLYYVSNRCELVCADAEGFLDGENDGPYTDEKYKDKQDGDFIWVLDMFKDLDVFPHNLATCSPIGHGDVVYVCTSNGVDEGHLNLPEPDAPSFLAVDKKTGKVLWERSDPGSKVFHGQWSSPAYGVLGGAAQVIFGAGDGWCYSYEPKTGEILWKFNLNPPGAKYILGGRGTANEVIATPVLYDDKVFVCVGQDPEHGDGVGHFYAIDATKRGDVTESAKLWHFGDDAFHRSMSTCAIADGLLYISDLRGFLYCLDVKNGERFWKHDLEAAVWGSPYVVDGKVMIGTEDGTIHVLEHSKTQKVLAKNDMDNAVYTTPVAANGVLYVTNNTTLVAIGKKGPRVEGISPAPSHAETQPASR